MWVQIPLLLGASSKIGMANLIGKDTGYFLVFWDVAQLVEHRTLTPEVVGSNPTIPSILGCVDQW